MSIWEHFYMVDEKDFEPIRLNEIDFYDDEYQKGLKTFDIYSKQVLLNDALYELSEKLDNPLYNKIYWGAPQLADNDETLKCHTVEAVKEAATLLKEVTEEQFFKAFTGYKRCTKKEYIEKYGVNEDLDYVYGVFLELTGFFAEAAQKDIGMIIELYGG
jgi:Domain of unknown function (DUF1877)